MTQNRPGSASKFVSSTWATNKLYELTDGGQFLPTAFTAVGVVIDTALSSVLSPLIWGARSAYGAFHASVGMTFWLSKAAIKLSNGTYPNIDDNKGHVSGKAVGRLFCDTMFDILMPATSLLSMAGRTLNNTAPHYNLAAANL
jgi:hypothetical protein